MGIPAGIIVVIFFIALIVAIVKERGTFKRDSKTEAEGRRGDYKEERVCQECDRIGKVELAKNSVCPKCGSEEFTLEVLAPFFVNGWRQYHVDREGLRRDHPHTSGEKAKAHMEAAMREVEKIGGSDG